MDKFNLKKAYTRAIDRNNVYSSNEGYAMMYKNLIDLIIKT
jgi:hypothetical protein